MGQYIRSKALAQRTGRKSAGPQKAGAFGGGVVWRMAGAASRAAGGGSTVVFAERHRGRLTITGNEALPRKERLR